MHPLFGNRSRFVMMAVIVGGLLLVLHFYSPKHPGLWSRTFFDSMHAPLFGVIAVTVFLLWAPNTDWRKRVLIAFVTACSLGLLSEAAQIVTARDASLGDFVVDCAGAAGFLALAIAVQGPGELGRSSRTGAAVFGTLLLAWVFSPLAIVSAAYLERNTQHPVIYDGGSLFSRPLTRVQNIEFHTVAESPKEPAHAVVAFHDAPWPGVAFHNLWPDWSAYSSLQIDLLVEGERPLNLNLRVHDRRHERIKAYSDRFTRAYELAPGRHTLSVAMRDLAEAPRDRRMDLTQISELIIFGTEAEAGRSFRLYEIRLR